jgi:hypothetical protein
MTLKVKSHYFSYGISPDECPSWRSNDKKLPTAASHEFLYPFIQLFTILVIHSIDKYWHTISQMPGVVSDTGEDEPP